MKSNQKRKELIMEMFKTETFLKIADLSKQFQVSEITIRRDFDELEAKGWVTKVPGGAVLRQPTGENSLQEKERFQQEEKLSIAKKCKEIVQDGQVVMLSAGSTTMYIARELKDKKELTVVTTGINIAFELSGLPHIQLVIAGGPVLPKSYAMVGHIAERTLKELKADIAFIGVDGIDLEHGFTTTHLSEAYTDLTMMQSAKRSIVVADHTKFGRVALSVVAPIEQVSEIITDAKTDPRFVSELEKRGITVIRPI
ncbi:DeoR/GlpR family DNA-binding transcription regulator [Lihuaxuella thermophila]|uniref:DeoR family transcriptional regulator, aga operon transcriptional repressor/DeoR family transcriptional regulator, fructose operon transcriptional repressor n=1 Tax=Lihuaxuella thermophila TaxID=1173111 RepID=A0A1H8CLD9_9BACL|nr:DeoR/GlpR family DNA-binding transcription regulator [Lihuaxuella thermophila]SEM96091.1 DeoR family transcriptional regulator, aga operon transcriptional repressor/DeoR family transcriptional regulator, fructose operon transcriptional repressor [Lihuaxuella thermophila]